MPIPPIRPVAAGAPGAGLRGEFVYTQLRTEIVGRSLLPGERLREVDIAERLGVSRTPVREALKRLESDGLVAFNAARVLVVAELTHNKVMELYAMREVLSGAAARFAAEQASPLEVEHLKQLAGAAGSGQTAEEAAALNRRLHDAIARAAHNDYLLRAMMVLSDAMALLGDTTYSVPGRIESGREENQIIVECIVAGDTAGAEEAARQHIRRAGSVRLGMLFGAKDDAV
jgi:DNA-binding GntR family transcriptional regulator